MSNSSLVNYYIPSPNHSGKRLCPIERISPHCVVGQCSVQSLGDWFSDPKRKASSNYGIGKDGKIGMFVEEKNRSWCTSSAANDNRAVTIECASDVNPPYAFNTAVYQSLINLCVDICKRNEKTKLLWIPDKTEALSYKPNKDEMIITLHRWFSCKSCPGDWLVSKLDNLTNAVNEGITGDTPEFKPYLVRILTLDVTIRKGAGCNTKKMGTCGPGVYTIVAEKCDSNGTAWGFLKSGAGWICLDYAYKI